MRRGKGFAHLVAQNLHQEKTFAEIGLDEIVPNKHQPRRVFTDEAIQDLAGSIREHGVIQPISVRQLPEGKYEIIAGERRWRASKVAGLVKIPVVVRDVDAKTSLELALIENLQREDISAMECAWAYKRLMDEFKMGQEQVADRVGKARSSISNTLRLLKLPKEIQEALQHQTISEGHARALMQFPDEAQQLMVFEIIKKGKLSVREVEKMAQAATNAVKEARKPMRTPNAAPQQWAPIQDALAVRFGTPVKMQAAESGKGGRIVVDFYSEDDLQRLLDLLMVSLM